MSAGNFKNRVTAICCGEYSFYTVLTESKLFVAGGVPPQYADVFTEVACEADGVILLTSKPEFTGGLESLIKLKPEIEIYATAAGLRNAKEIVNREINEKLIKDGMVVEEIKFLVTPNLQWVDTAMVLVDDALISGECFGGFDGSAAGLKGYFDARLKVNGKFVLNALKKLRKENISVIYPSFGMACPQGSVCVSGTPDEIFDRYEKWAAPKNHEELRAAVIYSSVSGFTAEMAEYVSEVLKGKAEVKLIDAEKTDSSVVNAAVDDADMLFIGTCTINRNAPKSIWQAVTSIDLVNKRTMPYHVFGSFGWAGDGIKLIDKTLSAMGMRSAGKPTEVLFKASDEDFGRLKKAVLRVLEKCEGR